MTPLELPNRPARPANTAIIFSTCHRAGDAGECHDLVCAHAGVRAATERLERSAAARACAGPSSRLADPGVISCKFKSDRSVRQKSQAVADLLQNGHLQNDHGPYATCWKAQSLENLVDEAY